MSNSTELSKEINIDLVSGHSFLSVCGVETFIKNAENEIGSIVFDSSTKKGRDECRSFSSKIGKLRIAVDKVGKAEADKAKALPKIIDANRRMAKERLTILQVSARASLTEFEALAEKEAEAKQAIAEQEALQVIIDNDHELALLMYGQYKSEKIIADQQRANERLEMEKQAVIDKEKAVREATANALLAKEEAEKLAVQAQARAERAELEAIERDRLHAIEAEEHKAQRARNKAEAERLQKERAEAEAKAEREHKERAELQAEEFRATKITNYIYEKRSFLQHAKTVECCLEIIENLNDGLDRLTNEAKDSQFKIDICCLISDYGIILKSCEIEESKLDMTIRFKDQDCYMRAVSIMSETLEYNGMFLNVNGNVIEVE